jgi:hypothetical protein
MHAMKVWGRYLTVWVFKKWISTTRCNFNSAGTHSIVEAKGTMVYMATSSEKAQSEGKRIEQ